MVRNRPAGEASSAEDVSDEDGSSIDEEMEDAPLVADSQSHDTKKRKITNEDPTSTKRPKVLEESNVIFVARLPNNIDDERLKKEFASYGEILSTRVVPPRGFGFVEFADKSSAAAAVGDSEKEIDGSTTRISWSSTRTEKEPTTILHVANLSPDATEDGLWEAFGKYGIVLKVHFRSAETLKKPNGFANVEFSSETSAASARKALTETELFGRKVHIEFATGAVRRRGGGKC